MEWDIRTGRRLTLTACSSMSWLQGTTSTNHFSGSTALMQRGFHLALCPTLGSIIPEFLCYCKLKAQSDSLRGACHVYSLHIFILCFASASSVLYAPSRRQAYLIFVLSLILSSTHWIRIDVLHPSSPFHTRHSISSDDSRSINLK